VSKSSIKVLGSVAGAAVDVLTHSIGGDEIPVYKVQWGDENASKDVTATTPLPVVLSHIDPALAIAEGEIAGHSHINKFGRIENIDTTDAPVDIVNGLTGLYSVLKTAARTHQCKSVSAQDIGAVRSSGTITTTSTDKTELIDSSATFISDGVAVGDPVLNDTQFDHTTVESIVSETELVLVGYHDGQLSTIGDTYRVVQRTGTGTAVLHITKGILSTGYHGGEFIILNGTTNVPTVNTYWRINRCHADGTGSNDSNVGRITVTADTEGYVTAAIEIGKGQTQMAFDTVPRGKTGYITNYYGNIGRQGKTAAAMFDIELYFRKFITANGTGKIVEHDMSVAVDGTSHSHHCFNPYKTVKELTDVWLTVSGLTDNGTYISAGFDMILVDS